MLENINYESIIIGSVVAYTLAFYFKNFSYLIENHGWAIFIFFHIPVFGALLISTDALGNHNDNLLTMIFAGVFLIRFFRKENV